MEKESSKKKKIVGNYIFNASYQLFLIIIPLITTPYISRVLGAAGVGQYSFTNSIVSYFVVFAALGFTIYGQRYIAKYQRNKHEQSVAFWELMIAKFITSLISIAVFWVLILLNVFGDSYSVLLMVQSINILSTLLDVVFIYQGNEKFRTITIRNMVIRTITTVCIFVFVKKETDVWIFVLCNAAALLFSNLSLWITLPKIVEKISIKEINIKRHIKPVLKLFVPTVAITVYTMVDKTLIGLMVPGTVTVIDEQGVETVKKIADIENGYYNQSEQIIKMATTVIAALGTVMIPRNSQQLADGDYDGFKKNVDGAMKFVMLLGYPIMFGLMAIAMNFTSWFYGPGFEKTQYLIMILAPLSLILGFSNVLGMQYLLPLEKDKKYTICILSGAAINVVANLILIPFLWSYGACIATVLAEACVTVLMFIHARKDVSFFDVFIKKGWKYFASGLLMFGVVFITQYFLSSHWYFTVLLMFEGVVVYFASLIIMRESFTVIAITKIKSILLRNKGNDNE